MRVLARLQPLLTLLAVAILGFSHCAVAEEFPQPTTIEALENARTALAAEQKEVAIALEQAEASADTSEQERLALASTTMAGLDLQYSRHISELRQAENLKATKAKLISQPELEAAPPEDAKDQTPFLQLEFLRDSLATEEEHQVQLELTIQSVERNITFLQGAFTNREKERRKAKEALDLAKDSAEKVARGREYQQAVLLSNLTAESLAVRQLELSNAKIATEISRLRTDLLRATIASRSAVTKMSEEDLKLQLAKLEAGSTAIQSRLEKLRKQGIECEQNFKASSQKLSARSDLDAALYEEVETAKLCRETTQDAIDLLGERLLMLDLARELWSRRFRLQHEQVDLETAHSWNREVVTLLANLQSNERSQTSRLAEFRARAGKLEPRSLRAQQEKAAEAQWLMRQQRMFRDQIDLLGERFDATNAVLDLAEKLKAELQSKTQGQTAGDRLLQLKSALVGIWNYEIFSVSDHPITPQKLIVAFVLLLCGIAVAKRASRVIATRLLPRFGLQRGEAEAIQAIVYYLLVFLAALFALHAVHVPLTVFTLAGGAVAIGVGFGSQNLINNFISGLILLFERPIRVGDLVDVDGTRGRIQNIGIRSTRLMTADNRELIVPNSILIERNVTNWTLSDQRARLLIPVGVSYSSDPKTVKTLLLTVAKAHVEVLPNPEPVVLFGDFAESALIFQLLIWVDLRNSTDRAVIESDIRFEIHRVFADHGIEMPFPQRTLSVQTGKALAVRLER